MKYKYFLFDWDGSLANTLIDWFRFHKMVLARNGVVVPDEVICEETFGKLDKRALGIKDYQRFEDEVEREILPTLDKASLNPGVSEVLKLIKEAGGKIAITTDSKRRWLEKAVELNGLNGLVDCIVAREDVTKRKPDPEVALTALKLIGGRVEETLVTGDNWRDIELSRSAGIDCCLYFPDWYQHLYRKEDQVALDPTYMITDFGELRNLI